MKHTRQAVLLFLSLLLTACGQLWGGDPTSEATPAVFWTIDPTTPLPFATFTPVIVSPTPNITDTPTTTPDPSISPTPTGPNILYYSQAGDTLSAVAAHFGVTPNEIHGPGNLSVDGFLIPETPLVIPKRLDELNLSPSRQIIPDSEIVYSPSAIDFNTTAYVTEHNGHLNDYQQYLSATGWTSGADSVRRIAIENSINPRLLLALIEYESGWVLGQPSNLAQSDYPLGYIDFQYRMLYRQMMWAVEELSTGYYGWRSGNITELSLVDGKELRLSPDLNAGTVALQYFFARRYSYDEWLQAIDPETGFMSLYQTMFGDPYQRADVVEPLIPSGANQPVFILPFESKKIWSYTGGPHSAWGFQNDEEQAKRGALAALDFAPAADATGCGESDAWVLAVASGVVVRSGNGVLVMDLDGDGYEQTGWNVLYMHISEKDRPENGAWIQAGERIGHPSCEGGTSTGTHMHIARKYNGEWVLADGPIPFVMSGWTAHAGDEPYHGTLTKDDKIVIANQNGIFSSQIIRLPGE